MAFPYLLKELNKKFPLHDLLIHAKARYHFTSNPHGIWLLLFYISLLTYADTLTY